VLHGIATGSAGSTAKSVTVARPSGTAQNDVILATVLLNQNVSTPGSVTAPDASWTQDLTLIQDGGMGATTVFHKIAGAIEPANYTFAVTFGSGGAGAVFSVEAMAVSYGNVSAVAPIDVPVAETFKGGTTPSAPSLTIPAGHNSDLLIALFSLGSGNVTVGTPPGMTAEKIFNDTTHGAMLAWFDQQLGAAGATGTRTSTLNSSHTVTGVSIALAPNAASSVTPTPIPAPTSTP
jgi:hypothetical protein